MRDYNTIAKQMRLERGLSQEDVALSIGISQSSMSGYETGKRCIPYEDLREIAFVLHYDLIFTTSDKNSDYTYRTRHDQQLVKTMRLRRGLSIRELAKKLNLDESTVSRYEMGLLRINQKMLKLIAEALDFEIDLDYKDSTLK